MGWEQWMVEDLNNTNQPKDNSLWPPSTKSTRMTTFNCLANFWETAKEFIDV